MEDLIDKVTASNQSGNENQFALFDHPGGQEYLFTENREKGEVKLAGKMNFRNEWSDVDLWCLPPRVKEKAEIFSGYDLVE